MFKFIVFTFQMGFFEQKIAISILIYEEKSSLNRFYFFLKKKFDPQMGF